MSNFQTYTLRLSEAQRALIVRLIEANPRIVRDAIHSFPSTNEEYHNLMHLSGCLEALPANERTIPDIIHDCCL